ncbi:hypothetical protein Maes01_00564 [Microbulbifer aestuariivivens]|uniref:Ankyrin repeat domain-containing protein n=1 Tax=Microbulbifer aestuariivivens TaxID=1908308 RepID=A0ABP9WLD5_9GAMM
MQSDGNDGHTALLVAARDGLPLAVNALLARGADQTLTDYYMKAVPLHKAAYNGHAGVVRALVSAPGAETVLNAQGPNNGYSPLHDATWHGHAEVVRALLAAGADPGLRGFDGRRPLDLARAYHYPAIVDLLSAHQG